MNTRNLEFLQDGLKYLGFDNKLNLELARQMQAAAPAFTLQADTQHFKDKMQATLHFRKSDESDMYFLNKYNAQLTHEDGSQKSQTFYINKNAGITFKEAYNLLSGRAVNKDLVNKEGEKYNAWVQLNFEEKDKHDNNKVKQYTANYGFDLQATVGKMPLKELASEEQAARLTRSLERGNLQSATLVKDGKEERIYLEANPQFKRLTVYDDQMKKVFQENNQKEASSQAIGKGVEQQSKQQRNSVGAKAEEGLLQKKRQSKKGLKR